MINKDEKKNSIKADIISDQWYLIDAKDQILGRLSSFLAIRLMGKHKTSSCFPSTILFSFYYSTISC